MPRSIRRHLLTLVAATGGMLAALSMSSAIASADVWTIEEEPTPPTLLSVDGIAPFYQHTLDQGAYFLTDHLDDGLSGGQVEGLLSTTQMMGMTNQDFVASGFPAFGNFPANSVLDILHIGGLENVYTDLVGLGAGGTNEITDTLVTPFGNFDIPVTFDADAFSPASGAAVDVADVSGLAAVLDADWATLVADLGSLF